MCGNIILSGICSNDFSLWGCSLKNESSSSSSSNLSSNSNSNSSSNPSSSSNPNSNSSSNPSSSSGSNPSSSSSSGSSSIYDYNSNSDPNPNPNLNPIPKPNLIPNPNLIPSSEVLTRCCNKCNYIKSLNNFDEGKYTCRSCTWEVEVDGIRAHVKKQHPDIELTRGFSRNLSERTINPGSGNLLGRSTKLPLYTSLDGSTKDPIINQTEEICSCKYYNFTSFLINNGINIEKVKENINL